MKAPEDKKTKIIPFRTTEAKQKQLKAEAKERGMTVSSLIDERVFHDNMRITPAQIAEFIDFEKLVSKACSKTDSETAAEIKEGAKRIWSWLK